MAICQTSKNLEIELTVEILHRLNAMFCMKILDFKIIVKNDFNTIGKGMITLTVSALIPFISVGVSTL